MFSDGITQTRPIFTPDNGFGVNLGLGYHPADLNRMNARFKVFMRPFVQELQGSTVLDLASHDGRWSWASLRLGASHVTGIEARPDLIAKGEHLFTDAKVRGRWKFIVGDIFDVLPQLRQQVPHFDVILCLGIFYHIMDHYLLLRLLRAFDPRLIILDTGLINDDRSFVRLELESTKHFLNTIASVEGQDENIIGLVSRGGLRLMCKALGISCEFLKWNSADFDSHANLEDYLRESPGGRQRYSAVLRPLKR